MAGASPWNVSELISSLDEAAIVIDTSVEEFAAFLSASRRDEVGHVVAIAWVFDPPGTHLLLVRHRLKGWSCPGGHLEDGEHPLDAAVRELFEETALNTVPESAEPFTLSCSIGCPRSGGQRLRHWTIGYRFIGARDAVLIAEPGQDVDWFALTELPTPRSSDLEIVSRRT